MRLNLKLGYVVTEDDKRDEPRFREDRKLTQAMIQSSVICKYREGVKGRGDLAAWSRVQRALKAAINTEKDDIELSLSDVRWVASCFRPEEYAVPVNFANWCDELGVYLEGLIRDEEIVQKAQATDKK